MAKYYSIGGEIASPEKLTSDLILSASRSYKDVKGFVAEHTLYVRHEGLATVYEPSRNINVTTIEVEQG